VFYGNRSVDHITARCFTNDNHITNKVVSCRRCNNIKSKYENRLIGFFRVLKNRKNDINGFEDYVRNRGILYYAQQWVILYNKYSVVLSFHDRVGKFLNDHERYDFYNHLQNNKVLLLEEIVFDRI
jgi:hypothetical protein